MSESASLELIFTKVAILSSSLAMVPRIKLLKVDLISTRLVPRPFQNFWITCTVSLHIQVFETDSATALYYLAKYFDVRHLRWHVRRFWKDDVRKVEACEMYYEHARILRETKILRDATEACHKNIMSI